MKAEEKRVQELAKEKKRFHDELEKHNQGIDQFISNLAYGDADALQEYIAIVVENSIYPDHFSVSHEFSFEPASAELTMRVSIPSPATFPSIKAYKYIKTSDEVKETPLSKKEHKDRYCSAVYQIALRSFHEVFEADRRGLIRTISLEVGTNESDPATGKSGFIPFVGASSEKESFMEFDLSNLVPLATLKHLGAVISKDPTTLVAVDVSGVRKS
jgi:restriction system protein